MAATITIEDGSAKVNSNSYVTLAEADSFFDTHPQAATWSASADDAKTRLLITAARVLDSCVDFIGYKVSALQAMQWPRVLAADRNQYNGAIAHTSGTSINQGDFPSDSIPKGIKDCQCELARFLLAENRLDDAPGVGLREFELTGTLRVAFDSGNLRPIIPEFLVNMLSVFGSVRGGKSGCVKLGRG